MRVRPANLSTILAANIALGGFDQISPISTHIRAVSNNLECSAEIISKIHQATQQGHPERRSQRKSAVRTLHCAVRMLHCAVRRLYHAAHRCSVLCERYSVLYERCSVLQARCTVLSWVCPGGALYGMSIVGIVRGRHIRSPGSWLEQTRSGPG